jgi:hypothetical protein
MWDTLDKGALEKRETRLEVAWGVQKALHMIARRDGFPSALSNAEKMQIADELREFFKTRCDHDPYVATGLAIASLWVASQGMPGEKALSVKRRASS